jgi:hypothetical protein
MTVDKVHDWLENLPQDIRAMALSTRLLNALANHDCMTADQILALRKREFMRWGNVGLKSWRELCEARRSLGAPAATQPLSHAKLRALSLLAELNNIERELDDCRVVRTRSGILSLVYETNVRGDEE